MWTKFFDDIYVVNLPERFDRLYDTTQLLNKYEIPFRRFEATRNTEGYRGLILSMKNLFSECLEKGKDKILVFEDDVEFCEEVEYFHVIMNKCVEGLREIGWQQFYLGMQHVVPFNDFVKPHILQVRKGYSTHAVAYGKHCMEHFVTSYVDEPIDNFFANSYHKFGMSYCAYPLLATQKTNYSDINKEETNWDMYIKKTYNLAVRHLFEK